MEDMSLVYLVHVRLGRVRLGNHVVLCLSRQKHAESIGWLIEYQAFLWSYDLAPPPPPLPSLSSLNLTSDTQEYVERETTYWRERGRWWGRSQIIRKPGPLSIIQYSLHAILLNSWESVGVARGADTDRQTQKMDSQMTQYEENKGKVGRKFPSYSIRNEENQGKVGGKFHQIRKWYEEIKEKLGENFLRE